MSGELAKALPETERDTLPLSKVVRSNINQFDVELYYRDPDIRDRRLSFRSGSRREKRIMEELARAAGKIPPYGELKKLMDENPGALCAAPSYIELELTGRCDLSCLFCYRTALERTRGDMDPALFRKILADMKDFVLPYTLCLGGSGEPLMHGKAVELTGEALADRNIERVIVETSGLYMDEAYRSLASGEDGGRLITIVNMNGCDSGTYAALHGEKHFDRVVDNIMALREALGGDSSRLYVQVMKINETESFLDRYYDFWEERKIPVILQKQNTYLGMIEDRRYSDLTPLERTPAGTFSGIFSFYPTARWPSANRMSGATAPRAAPLITGSPISTLKRPATTPGTAAERDPRHRTVHPAMNGIPSISENHG